MSPASAIVDRRSATGRGRPGSWRRGTARSRSPLRDERLERLRRPCTRPLSTRPVRMRPMKGSADSVVASIAERLVRVARPAAGAGTWSTIRSNSADQVLARPVELGIGPAGAARGVEHAGNRADRRRRRGWRTGRTPRSARGRVRRRACRPCSAPRSGAGPGASALDGHELGLRHRAFGGIDQQDRRHRPCTGCARPRRRNRRGRGCRRC